MIRKEAIRHVPLSSMAYAVSENALTIRLQVGKEDAKNVYLFYGDRVDPKKKIEVQKLEMEKVSSDALFDYYEVTFETEYTRVCYYFEISDESTTVKYYGRGFYEDNTWERNDFFQFPYIRREEVLAPAEWILKSRMYQIFPDSFASAKREILKASRLMCGDHGERLSSKLGGTIEGITLNLDYIQDLGFNLLYLNPIFEANSCHKYDTIDYKKVDPCFGTEEEFKTLVKEAHRRGIRVILDGVFNHCGSDFGPFRDVREKGQKSKYVDWFYDLKFPIQYNDPPNYQAFAYVKEMPKLNTSNPEVADYICSVGTYWVKEFDIDGWRLDVANEVDHALWRRFKSEVRGIKKDTFFIGEVWEDASAWLGVDQFESAMNYEFIYLCRAFFAQRTIDAEAFDEKMSAAIMRYPYPLTLTQMNMLDSHDVPRFLEICEKKRERLELALVYLFTSPGIPSVFYGDECYVSGLSEDEYRAPMPWDKIGGTGYDLVRTLNHIRDKHPALYRGSYRTFLADGEKNLYGFLRKDKETGEEILVLLNNTDVQTQVSLGAYKGQDLMTEREVDTVVSIEPMSAKIIKLTIN